jgi:hypothetical protein
MTIFGLIIGLLVLLAFFWWVASLAHAFFTSPTERTRFAARPGPGTHMWTAPVPQEVFNGLIGSLASICPAC